jgi:hypothetical protein
MPSSLIIVGLVVAWLVVLVPMIVRKRQEIAKTADSALAARVVRCAEEGPMTDTEEIIEDAPVTEEPPPTFADRPYRPGRGGFDPEAAAVIAKAKYAFRQRVVLAMLVGAVVTAILAAIVFRMLWWPHAAIDLTLVSYLVYLRRQVRIEQEIRERRLARMRSAARIAAHQRMFEAATAAPPEPEYAEPAEPPAAPAPAVAPPRATYPGAAVVELDDEDPAFDDLDHPDNLPYRRAAGE